MKGEDTMQVDGLSAPVEIFYDRAGVPHIKAGTQLNAYFAQGYVTAEARLWQLDLFRRTASGRLSEAFGKRALAGDKFQRALGLPQLARQRLECAPPGVRSRLAAYAEGVNECARRVPLPIEFGLLESEFDPWREEDALLCAEMRSILNASWRADLVRLAVIGRVGEARARDLFVDYFMPDDGPEKARQGPAMGLEFADVVKCLQDSEDALRLAGLQHTDIGTNTWVVDGSRAASGAPLLANDPHMGFVAPNLNFLVHISAPGLNVRGLSFPGIPGVTSGHNERIAWGAAVLMADTQDVFIEEIDESERHYRFRGAWSPLGRREEEIQVRGKEPVRIVACATHHGPIVNRRGRWGLALRWERLDCPADDPTFHSVNTAQDWASFREALRSYTGPANDFTFADVDGNIGVQSAGCVPLRASGDGSLPAVGAGGQHEWTGYVPFEELPSDYRPADGYIVRSNQNHDAGRCKHFLSRRWHPPYRARRVKHLINAGRQEHSVETFARIQFDRFSGHGSFLAEKVMAALEGTEPDAIQAAARDVLRTWDGRLDPDSPGASIVKECSAVLKARLLAPHLGKRLLMEYQKNWPISNLAIEWLLGNGVQAWLPDGMGSCAELLRSAFSEAVENLRCSFGSDDVQQWYWGELHAVRFAHPMDHWPSSNGKFRMEPIQVGGDGECVFSARSVGDFISSQQTAVLGSVDTRPAIFGASARLIWDLFDWENSSMLLNLGQSGDPDSPYYCDQLELWRTGQVQKLPFAWPNVEAAGVKHVSLIPGGQCYESVS